MSPGIDTATALFAVAVAANAMGSALGMAGGIFLVPAMVAIAHAPLSTSIAVSLVSVVACSCASAPQFLRARLTNIRLAVVLEVATAGGAFAGVLVVDDIPARAVFILFTLVLAASTVQLFVTRNRETGENTPRSDLDLRLRVVNRDQGYRVHRIPWGLGLMFGAGLLSTLLGIGSGVLKIPAMDSALRLPIKVSSATANLMIGVTAAGGAAAYLAGGHVDADLVAPVVLGSVAGSLLGAPVLTRVSPLVLRVVFATVLAALTAVAAAGLFGIGPFGSIT